MQLLSKSACSYVAGQTQNHTETQGDYDFRRCVCALSRFSRVHLFATLGTVACQAPLSMGTPQARILEWVAMPSSRRSPDPGIEPTPLTPPALAGRFFTTSATCLLQNRPKPIASLLKCQTHKAILCHLLLYSFS